MQCLLLKGSLRVEGSDAVKINRVAPGSDYTLYTEAARELTIEAPSLGSVLRVAPASTSQSEIQLAPTSGPSSKGGVLVVRGGVNRVELRSDHGEEVVSTAGTILKLAHGTELAECKIATHSTITARSALGCSNLSLYGSMVSVQPHSLPTANVNSKSALIVNGRLEIKARRAVVIGHGASVQAGDVTVRCSHLRGVVVQRGFSRILAQRSVLVVGHAVVLGGQIALNRKRSLPGNLAVEAQYIQIRGLLDASCGDCVPNVAGALICIHYLLAPTN